jgi:hypothetical protein
MDKLNIEYPDQNSIPEAFRPLYAETDGKFMLTGIEGMKTQADIDRLSSALSKERADHATVRDQFKPFSKFDFADVQAKLDKYPELEAAASGKLDDTQIQTIADGRVAQRLAPLERNLETVTTERDDWKTRAERAEQTLITRDRNDGVRAAALEMKSHVSALPDIEMAAGVYFEQTDDGKFITKANITGVTPGLDFKAWLREMQKSRPHWWPQSEGGGAGGGGGGQFSENPWSHDHWNMTKQGEVVRKDGMEVAQRMATAAGTSFGGGKPLKK